MSEFGLEGRNLNHLTQHFQSGNILEADLASINKTSESLGIQQLCWEMEHLNPSELREAIIESNEVRAKTSGTRQWKLSPRIMLRDKTVP